MRKFVSLKAVRANVPLLLALIGPSTSGKTYSAHRLAKGIARVQPGPVYGIDTENKGTRMLELADKFDFIHMPFEAPFGSLDYLAAIQQAASEGARTVIVDSMSHEHEGEGGCLWLAAQEVEEAIARKVRFKDLPNAECDEAHKSRQRLNKSSWIKPKAYRNQLITGIQQLSINVILLFRAKEKIDPKPQPGKDFATLGWQAIGGDEFWYEMTTRFLLMPGANGKPSWNANDLEKGERAVVRCPEQFRGIIDTGKQIDEAMGEAMARWASGDVSRPAAAKPASLATEAVDAAEAMLRINACTTLEALKSTATKLRELSWTDAQSKAIKATIDARSAALKNTAG
jgi:hypothetical protein